MVRVVLFGDSHAIQWFNALKRIATERNWRLTTFLKSHCPAPDLGPPWRSAGCSAWRAAVLRELKTQRPDLVVLASATRYLDADSVLVWQEATGRTLAALAATGLRVAVIRDTPVAPFNISDMPGAFRAAFLVSQGPCAFLRAPALRPAFYAAERKSAVQWRGVSFIDMTNALCGDEMCPAVRDGLIVYRDDNHLTGRYAAKMASILEPYLLGP